MTDRSNSSSRFGRKAIVAILRHHQHKAMLRYLQYLKSDSLPISEEERRSYRPPVKHWWWEKAEIDKKT